MHKRQDFPALDPSQQRRLVTSGLDEIHVRTEAASLEARERPNVPTPSRSASRPLEGAA
jgi:hypothetical protein